MRAGNFLPDGVSRKLDVFLAKEAGYFQEIGLAQSDIFLALRAGNILPQGMAGKPDVNTAGRAGHLDRFLLFLPATSPKAFS